METTVKKATSRRQTSRPTKKRMSLSRFMEWADQQEDGYKYEWKQGVVERYEAMVKKEGWTVIQNVTRALVLTESYQKGATL